MADGIANREQVLGAVRRSLRASGSDAARRRAVAERLEGHARNLVPERAQGSEAKRLQVFKDMLAGVNATVTEVARPEEVPEAAAAFLRGHNLPPRIRMGEDGFLNELPWYRVPSLEHNHGPAEEPDEASLSHAFGAVAETGTLVLASGPDNPTTLNFLPENHIVVVEADHVEAAYEDVWVRLRARYGEGTMPRVVNMITGPSRTGDIEQTIQLGAHGPRRLHVIIVGKRHIDLMDKEEP